MFKSQNLNNCAPHPCLIGVEVVISNGFEEQFLFLLSRMMQMLLKGLNVINCVSAKVNQSVLIVKEVISYLKKDKLQGYLFKLDFHKAFDSVNGNIMTKLCIVWASETNRGGIGLGSVSPQPEYRF